MFTRPDDLRDTRIVGALADGWALTVREITYAAVGFGSYHWRVTGDRERWFVTVDDLDTKRREASETRHDAAARLSTALTVARSLHDSGLEFVVAPERTMAGRIVHPIDPRYVAALYPYVVGETHASGAYPTRADRLAVLDRLVTLHRATGAIAGVALRDDFAIPRRDHLVAAFSDRTAPWGPGPYAAGAHDLLGRHGDAVARVLARYDHLVIDVASQPDRMVLTHGEPHRANTINTAEGVVLIDWDTALLAPPERDLWPLIDEEPQIADDYHQRTGIAVDDTAVQLYRLRWDLCEISLYLAQFRAPHQDNHDTRVAWDGLLTHLDPRRWNTAP